MTTTFSRREFLKSSASTAALPLATSPPVAFFLTSSAAHAADPITIAIAAASVISAFMKSGGTGGLDPASQEYLERIIENQEMISGQITEINLQIEDLAAAVNILAPQTVSLDRRVSAKGVFHRAAGLEISFLQSSLKRQKPEFSIIDQHAFSGILADLERSAADHVALVEEVGQSVDTIVAIDALRLAIGALINAARIAGLTTPDAKRGLERALALTLRGANVINREAGATSDNTFRGARAKVRTEILNAANALVKAGSEDSYAIKAAADSYLSAVPTEISGTSKSTTTVTVWDTCGGKILEPSGQQLPAEKAIYRPGRDPAPKILPICKGGYRTYKLDQQDPAKVFKSTLPTPDEDLSYFTLTVDPFVQGSKFVQQIEAFNEAKVRDSIYHGADLILARTLKAADPMITEIGSL